MFELDPRLAADTVEIGTLDLCRVLLMNDVRYPWLILVPGKPDLAEIGDLDRDDRLLLMDEIETASAALAGLYNPIKMNVGALGNIVRQLHIHIVGRAECDPAWPGPVWGHSPADAYSDEALAMRVADIGAALEI
jgi:diadenosine tetraphosphate (Ap4A) HIT family hydrolase